MISRKYTKRLELWQTIEVADPISGYTTANEFVTKVWANVKTVANSSKYVSRSTDLGITDPSNAIIITLRYRKDIQYNAINQFFVYRGVKYIIQNAPVSINLQGSDVEIYAIREKIKDVPVIPVGGKCGVFDNTFGSTFRTCNTGFNIFDNTYDLTYN